MWTHRIASGGGSASCQGQVGQYELSGIRPAMLSARRGMFDLITETSNSRLALMTGAAAADASAA
jgi:hypothetical protein